MRHNRLTGVVGLMALPPLLLAGCDSAYYRNATHPTYGAAEYKSDLDQCRKQNSTTIITQGYDLQTQIRVDEPKVQACMSARGWQEPGS